MTTTIEELRELVGDENRVILFWSKLVGNKSNRCRYKIVQQKTQTKCICQCHVDHWNTTFTLYIPRATATDPGGLSYGGSVFAEQIAAHLRALKGGK